MDALNMRLSTYENRKNTVTNAQFFSRKTAKIEKLRSIKILQFCKSCFDITDSDEENIKMKRRHSSSCSLPRKMSLRTFSRQEKCLCETKPKKFRKSFYDMIYQDETCTAIVHTTDGWRVPVYFLVLSAISMPMYEAFLGSSEKVVTFNLSVRLLQIITDLAYTGACDIQKEELDEAMIVAHKYKIFHLGYMCGEMCLSNLCITNALETYRKSSQFLCEHYAQKIKRFVTRNFSDLIKLDSFKVNHFKVWYILSFVYFEI